MFCDGQRLDVAEHLEELGLRNGDMVFLPYEIWRDPSSGSHTHEG